MQWERESNWTVDEGEGVRPLGYMAIASPLPRRNRLIISEWLMPDERLQLGYSGGLSIDRPLSLPEEISHR